MEAATSARGTVHAVVGHLLEARSTAAPPGSLAWSTGRSNVQAVWSFLPPIGTGDVAFARQGGSEPAPLELRTARDLTALDTTTASHPGCATVSYRGLFLLHGRFLHYEVCDASREIYVGESADLRFADSALAVSAAVPGAAATREAFELTLDGSTFVFTGAHGATHVTLRQGRLVDGVERPERVEMTPMGLTTDLRVLLHDVVRPAAPGPAGERLGATLLRILADALP